jgi:cysteinyl-tRNA synthetase
MDLRLYDTLTKTKQPFRPLDPAHVRMYVCGPTVYDYAHIGNARPVIVFDVLYRLLRHLAKQGAWDGGKGETRVTYVRNITDVDDKINERAARDYPDLPLNEAIAKVTEATGRQFHEDVDALGCLRPDVEPRATQHIGEMRDIIERLIANGNAYVAEGHVLFAVATDRNYGKLARRSLDEMVAGARVDVAPYKRDAMDFVLWKPSKAGEPSWPSPAGIAAPGRPGWHIECSAMAWKHLGEQFDIHGGGIDLVFPHHENEIAQSCCAFHTERMAQVWMHNGFLQVEGEKMSKSTGNFVTIRELFEGWQGLPWQGDVIRLAMLSTHYRQPIDFSVSGLEQAMISMRYFKTFGWVVDSTEPSAEFIDALYDDLNTPRAVAELHRLLKISRESSSEVFEKSSRQGMTRLDPATFLARRQLGAGLMMLGIDIEKYDPDHFQKQVQSNLSSGVVSKVEHLVSARAAARARKDFKESDRIRDELAAMGVVLKDGKDANGNPVTTWEIAR